MRVEVTSLCISFFHKNVPFILVVESGHIEFYVSLILDFLWDFNIYFITLNKININLYDRCIIMNNDYMAYFNFKSGDCPKNLTMFKKNANLNNAYTFINFKSDLKDEIFMVLDRLSVAQRGPLE